MEFLLVLIMLALIVVFWIFVANEFEQIANEKGYSGYFWWVFLFWIIGILMVIALPDRGKNNSGKQTGNPANKIKTALNRSDAKSDFVSGKSTWLCKQCNTVNSSDVGFCKGCGTYMSNTSSNRESASWECSKCGKTNPSYTGTCSCGNSKYEN